MKTTRESDLLRFFKQKLGLLKKNILYLSPVADKLQEILL